MKKIFLYSVLLMLLLLIDSSVFAQDKSIVSIYKTIGNRTEQGTGFFISPRGDIATAYHVVENADKLQIFDYNKESYSEVIIVNFDINADIAIIKIKPTQKTNHLQLLDYSPQSLEELKIIGNPRSIKNQKFRANATQDGTIDSEAISDERNQPLFTINIQLIPLVFTVYEGMSGAPVINSNGYAIGILSGSLAEGGSYAWAIPISYLLDTMEQPPVHMLVDSNFPWKPLKLMSKRWKKPLRSFLINNNALNFSQEYHLAVAKLKRINDEIAVNSSIAANEIIFGCDPEGLSPTIQHFTYYKKFVRLVSARINMETKVRNMISDFKLWIEQTDIDKKQKNNYTSYADKLFDKYPELDSSSIENIMDIDINALKAGPHSHKSCEEITSICNIYNQLGFSMFDQAEVNFFNEHKLFKAHHSEAYFWC